MSAQQLINIFSIAFITWAGNTSALYANDPIVQFGVSSNGRRFLINGKPTFLAGFREGFVGGNWNNVYWNHARLPADHPISPNASQVDYQAYAKTIVRHGMNMVRCNLIHMQAGSGRVHGNNQRKNAPNFPPAAPYTERPWARTGGGKAWDGLPRYNLDEWNNWYWGRLNEWVNTANKNGIVVEVTLFQQHNYYQIFTHYADNPLRPVNCNKHTNLPNKYGETAYPEFYGSNKVLHKAQEAFVDKVLDTIGKYPGVIYRIANEYNWTETWAETWAARIKNWGKANGRKLVVQIGGSMQQMKRMNKDIHSMDGSFIFRKPDGQACDPPSLIEVRLPGYCKRHKFDNTPPIVNATLLWMWEQLPSKVLIREGQTKPARKAWWSAFTGGAAGYFYHGAFEPEFNSEAARGTTTLVNVLRTFDTMVPYNQCIVDGQAYTLATPGQEYVAYFPNGGTAHFNLRDKMNIWEYKWFNPRTCQFVGSGQTSGQIIYVFTTPEDDDWILWICKTNK